MILVTKPRLLLAAPSSGSGKTTFVCGLLRLLLMKELQPKCFKCGPDYIDPMFHQQIIGAASGNLDLFLCAEETIRYLLAKNSQACDLVLIEGAMGYYDGVSGGETWCSSYHLAKVTQSSVVLLVNCRGMSISVAAQIKGYLTFRDDHQIEGVILNQISASLYDEIKTLLEEELGIKVFGYLPKLAEISLASRHLGLVTAGEVADLQKKVERLAEEMEKTIDWRGLIALAQKAPPFAVEERAVAKISISLRIGVAKDRAFCFYYQDNLALLEEMGAEIISFSPLEDKELPPDLDGLILGGGYPELYLPKLSANISLRRQIKELIIQGIPTIAECGGFMYLHQFIENEAGKRFPMVGIIDGGCYPKGKLVRFGYAELRAERENVLCRQGEGFKIHEFHYWESNNSGNDFLAQKPCRDKQWHCGHGGKNLYAGFPHCHFYSEPFLADNFLAKAETFHVAQKGGQFHAVKNL